MFIIIIILKPSRYPNLYTYYTIFLGFRLKIAKKSNLRHGGKNGYYRLVCLVILLHNLLKPL